MAHEPGPTVSLAAATPQTVVADVRSAPNVRKTVFVARQPIFDAAKDLYGYELLFRSGLDNVYDALHSDTSTLDVIANSLLVIGLDELAGGRRVFINFTRNLLVKGVADLLPADRVALEIEKACEPDEDVLAACERLKSLGYVLALDAFTRDDPRRPLLPFADIVKVDFLTALGRERSQIIRSLAGTPVQALAERVETVAAFDEAAACGYTFFQGYFFSKPIIRSGSRLAACKLNHLRMLDQINRPELSYDELEAIIKHDVALVYSLLKFINSAWFGLRYPITSIKHALILLGPKEVGKWYALVALRLMASDKPHELLLRCMTRAKMAEALAPACGLKGEAPQLFLVGLFSVIDALLDAPMADVLAHLPLDDRIKAALLGEPCPYRSVHDTLLAYEQGDWATFSACARALNLDESLVADAYTQSLRWSHEAFTLGAF